MCDNQDQQKSKTGPPGLLKASPKGEGVHPSPNETLKEAREQRDKNRKLVASDVDPSQNRKGIKEARAESAANSFEVIAREWFNKNEPTWAENHSSKIIQRLERDIFPWVGKAPVAEITPKESRINNLIILPRKG